jgi:hypothetical protein
MKIRRLFALAALALLAFPATAVAQNPAPGVAPGARNFELVGHEPLFNRGMNAAIAVYHNFVYVGNRTDASPGHPRPGVLVVNIARPRRPVVVNELPPEPIGQTSRELRVWPQQKLLIVMLFRCSSVIHACPPSAPVYSMKFYDLTDPVRPQLVSTYVPSFQPHEMFLWLDPQRPGRAVLYLSTPSGSADPNRPNLVVTDISGWRSGVFNEIVRFNPNPMWTEEQRRGLDVALHSMWVSDDGARTYLAYLGAGFYVLDTTQVANATPNPTVQMLTPFTGSPRWPNQTVHSSIPLPGRPYVLTTDELYGDLLGTMPNVHGCPFGWMHSIDVTDPANPRLIAEYRTEGNTTAFCSTPLGQDDVRASYTAHNPTAFSELAFISWHGGGLQAVDVTNPAAPTQAGFFTPTPLASVATEDPALTTTGNKVSVWTFPIVKNGFIYVGDIRNGLYALRYTGQDSAEVRRTIFREGNSNVSASCPVVSVTPRRVRAGRASTIRARVRLFGQPVQFGFVRLRGAASAGAITPATGQATFRVRPRRAGTIRVSATNVASQCVERITVRPAPRPRRPQGGGVSGGTGGAPLTGRLGGH